MSESRRVKAREGKPVIGLRRHTVRVVDGDPGWLAMGCDECRVLARLGEGLVLDAQHVGSTAVLGLPAKPILDIAVLVGAPSAVPPLIDAWRPGGYIYRGNHGDGGGHLFIREFEPDVRVAHIHVFASGDPQWDECLSFRDALRSDAALRERYAKLKQDLAARYTNNRPSYTAGKEEFIREVLGGLADGQS